MPKKTKKAKRPNKKLSTAAQQAKRKKRKDSLVVGTEDIFFQGINDSWLFVPNTGKAGVYVSATGGFRRAQEVLTIPNGAKQRSRKKAVQIFDADDKLMASHPIIKYSKPLLYSEADGWQAYAEWYSAKKMVQAVTASWTVPPYPSMNSSQVLYLFLGLQNIRKDMILQAVLEWSTALNPTGGWSLSIVHTENNQYKRTERESVDVGEKLSAAIELISATDDRTIYSCRFLHPQAANTQVETSFDRKVYCCVAFESHGISDPKNYPANDKTIFSDINVTVTSGPVSVNWEPKPSKERAVIAQNGANNAQIELYYA